MLPTSRFGASGWAPFMLWSLPEGSVFATTELPHGEQRVADPDGVTAYEKLWAELWTAALVGDAAVDFIRRVASASG